MNPCPTVHRSADPIVLRAYHRDAQERIRWRRAVAEWTSAQGIPGGQLQLRPSGAIQGVTLPPGVDVPRGWRRLKQDSNVVVPQLRSAEGKRLGRELGNLRPPADVRQKLPGIVASVMVEGRCITWRPELREDGAALYAVWQAEVPRSAASSMWHLVPLGAYYTLCQAEDGHYAQGAA